MKKAFPVTLLAIALIAIAVFNQGCEDSSKYDALNQKIDALSKKVDVILQNQDTIVHRIEDCGYYYNTNLLAHINEDNFKINLALENDIKAEMNQIERMIKPRYAIGFESIGDQIGAIQWKVDTIKQTTDQIESEIATKRWQN
jgi:hypothetical protein